jgi:Holin of 3TMs, for gene-transfer release
MITLWAALLGFLGSLLPEVSKQFQDRSDKKHELEILKIQISEEGRKSSDRLAEIGITADVEETKAIYQTYNSGVRFIDGFNASVRPVLAYAFFLLYASIKILTIYSLIKAGIPLVEVYSPIDTSAGALPWLQQTTVKVNVSIWDTEDKAIFAAILSFYFGKRGFEKAKG